MTRATKIVATLGPASSDPAVLERLLLAGVDVVRLNFSHGKAQDHIDRANLVRSVADKVGKTVALMADLQGPKIRVGKFSATVLPTLSAIALTRLARSMWSCALPWLKFSRTTSTPAINSCSSTAGSLDAGPRVATILVARVMGRLFGRRPCGRASGLWVARAAAEFHRGFAPWAGRLATAAASWSRRPRAWRSAHRCFSP